MTSRERVTALLARRPYDRIAITDAYDERLLARWRREGHLPESRPAQVCFDHDVVFAGFDQSAGNRDIHTHVSSRFQSASSGAPLELAYEAGRGSHKYLMLSFMDPFEDTARRIGRQRLLEIMARDTRRARQYFAESAEFTVSMCAYAEARGFRCDAACMFCDMAYDGGLFFSLDVYRALLHEFHCRICDFFRQKGMPVLFHCDGDMRGILPLLTAMGIAGVMPLQGLTREGLSECVHEYGSRLVVCGGIDAACFGNRTAMKRELEIKLPILTEYGNYLYQADGPLMHDSSYEVYCEALHMVASYPGPVSVNFQEERVD